MRKRCLMFPRLSPIKSLHFCLQIPPDNVLCSSKNSWPCRAIQFKQKVWRPINWDSKPTLGLGTVVIEQEMIRTRTKMPKNSLEQRNEVFRMEPFVPKKTITSRTGPSREKIWDTCTI
jgi:hypothetical protein